MRVQVKGLRVRVVESATSKGPGVRFTVGSARYEDVTAKYQGTGMMMQTSMSASSIFPSPSCVSHKVR